MRGMVRVVRPARTAPARPRPGPGPPPWTARGGAARTRRPRPTVGITICASGSVKQKPTRRRTSRPSLRVSRPSTRDPSRWSAATSPLSIRANVDLPGAVRADDADAAARSAVRRRRPPPTRSPYRWLTPREPRSPAPLDHHRHALAAADRDRGQPVAAPVGADQLGEQPDQRAPPPTPPRDGPRASAPPSTQTRAGSSAELVAAGQHLAGERLVELDRRRGRRRRSPARASACRAAGTRPRPGRCGSTPAVAVASTRSPGTTEPPVRSRRPPRPPRRRRR